MKEEILQNRVLENGIRVVVRDRSRRIAGDRWQVKVEAEVSILRETVLLLLSRLGRQTSDLPVDAGVSGDLIGRIIHRERQFVADQEEKQVRDEEASSLLAHIEVYLSRPDFAGQLLLAVLREEAERRLLDASRPDSYGHLDEDDGPADFSSLFRDQ